MKSCIWFPKCLRCLIWALTNSFHNILIQPFCVDLKTSSLCWFLHILYGLRMLLIGCGRWEMSSQFMRYGSFRLNECIDSTTNITELPSDVPAEKHCIKLIWADDMPRITLPGLCSYFHKICNFDFMLFSSQIQYSYFWWFCCVILRILDPDFWLRHKSGYSPITLPWNTAWNPCYG